MRTRARRRTLAAVLLLAGVFGIGLAAGQLSGQWTPPWGAAGGTGAGDGLPASAPDRIKIPSLAVDAPVHQVGLDPSGSIAAPPMELADEAAWYRDSPSPGQYGAAVIVGHVDDQHGPAVFYGVSQLGYGDRIEVSRADGEIIPFTVTAVRSYPKTRLPADEVYGDFSEPALRLISCGGQWVGGQTGYADNVVVFATLAEH